MVVATPIGNLGDLSPRAVEELAGADLICCEDTRRTGRLLAHAGIVAPGLRRLDAHTEAAAADDVVTRIADGARVALVTDAGTPGVSDPGARLVGAVVAAGLSVTTVPGPVAAVAALVLSGFDTARFAVDGFLPRKGADRSARLTELAVERRTTVLYEAPGRVGRTLSDLARACGPDRRVAVARELTKLHEEVWRAPLGEAAAQATQADPRGEIVLVLEGATAASGDDDDAVRDALRTARERGLGPGRAAAEVAAALGRPRREVYALALDGVEQATPDGEGIRDGTVAGEGTRAGDGAGASDGIATSDGTGVDEGTGIGEGTGASDGRGASDGTGVGDGASGGGPAAAADPSGQPHGGQLDQVPVEEKDPVHVEGLVHGETVDAEHIVEEGPP